MSLVYFEERKKIFVGNETYLLMKEFKKSNPVRGKIKLREPMSNHTSWRTGGVAEEYFEPADLQDICNYLINQPQNRQLLWLGLGSNLLVRDGGFHGSVIAYSKALNKLIKQTDARFYVEAGVPCAKVARFCAKAGYTGGEFLCGIPGVFGGALAMNAGAFGSETWDIVEKVTTVNRSGQVKERSRDEINVGYRSVITPEEEWFISAQVELIPDKENQAIQKIRDLLNRRSDTQPVGMPSCGSVFRNTPEKFAAQLIDQSGLKGTKVGGACISQKHANFIINTGNASAEDIEKLVRLVQKKVYESHGVELQLEVKIVGENN